MSISSAVIASNALGFLGEAPVLTLLDETVRARLCNQHFEVLRDALLASHPWNFAKARVNLVAVSTPEPVFDYSYTFALPTDYIRMVKAWPEWAEFEIEGSNIVTDSSAFSLSYVRRFADYNAYNPLFVLGFEYKLAAAVCPVLKNNMKITQMMEELGEAWLLKAKIMDAQDEKSKEIKSDDLITVRKVN